MQKPAHIILLFLSLHSLPGLAQVSYSTNPETGLKGWKFNQADMQLELIQRLPDQTRGFFLARGFSRKIADQIARSCVFQTIVRNTGSGNKTENTDKKAITVSLKQWRIIMNNKITPLKLKENWINEWSLSSVKPASRHAFQWALFPTEQTFHPTGDFNWGMLSFGLTPGDTFDLQIKWSIAGKSHQSTIKNIQCAPDKVRRSKPRIKTR